MLQNKVQYSYTDMTEDDLHSDATEDDSDDSISTYWYYGRWSRRWFNTYILIEDDSAHTEDDSLFTY